MSRAFLACGLSILALVIGAAPIATPVAAQSLAQPSFVQANPAFHDYTVGGGAYSAERVRKSNQGGLVPEPIHLPHLKSSSMSICSIVALPSTFDLRTTGKLTAVRDQGSCGDCWAFATMGSLESFLMPNESLDFSENNLKNTSGFDLGCCDGGNRSMAVAYLARWSGAIAESADPYNPNSCTSPAGLAPIKHVQDVIYVPNRAGATENASIKQAVMQYGAVYTTYYHSDSYLNASTGGYYYNGSGNANHAVCIVGWDDDFSASNFNTAPPGNGAFLIRNSWGAGWELSGYFWISYYDALLGTTENAVFEAEPVDNYDSIYQYDPLGWDNQQRLRHSHRVVCQRLYCHIQLLGGGRELV